MQHLLEQKEQILERLYAADTVKDVQFYEHMLEVVEKEIQESEEI